MEKLAPARIALLPGSVGSGADDLIVIAEERFPLRWQGEWIPVQPPRNYERFVTGPGGFLCWSEQANKFSCLYIRDTGDRDLFTYFLDRLLAQGWDGRYTHSPMRGVPLAVRLDGSVAHLIAGLHLVGNPTRMARVVYDRIALNENVQPGTMTGTVKIAGHALPPSWPLAEGTLQAAFLDGRHLTAALVGAGEVVRGNPEQPDLLEPLLTATQVTAQGVPAEQVPAARVTLLGGPRDTPVHVAFFLPGRVLVWHLPLAGPPRFVGDAQSVGSGDVLSLVARPDGQGWAVLLGSPGADPASPPTSTLYLTGPNFASPQPLELPGHSVADPAWSPTGNRLYFVVDGTEIWRSDSGQSPQRVAVGPAQMSLEAKQTP